MKGLPVDQQNEMVRDALYNMLNLESWMITAFCIYFLVVMRQDKPDIPPSAAALVKKEDVTQGMWKDTKLLFKNGNFMLVLIIFTFIYTVYSGLGFIINPLFIPFGYTPTQIAILAALFVLVGSVSAVVIGILLDKTKKYLLAIRFIPMAGTVIFVVGIFVIPTGNVAASLTVVCLGGIACVPIIAVCFSLGTEVSYPIQPALVLGLMMSSAQLSLFIMNFVFLALLSDQDGHEPRPIDCLIVLTCFPLVCSFLSVLVKEDLRRLNAS